MSDTTQEYSHDDIYDPSIQDYDSIDNLSDESSKIPDMEQDTANHYESDDNDFASDYLKTLYADYKSKIHSATIYMEKINKQQQILSDIITKWTGDLKQKYQILDTFTKSRSHSPIPGNFAIEQTQYQATGTTGDLKKVDTNITDSSEQINYNFNKLDQYLKFLGQTYYDAQDTVNKIYDRFMELYDNM